MSADVIDSPSQLPARMINEFAYCPRLFYLEYVDREFAHSADTLEGRLAHHRVDQESGKMPDSEELAEASRDYDGPDIQLHARSVMVGSQRLGAVARIDLIESEGTWVTPVDYKRGKAPDIPERAWEPERVQLCLQGLILRDNGYECEEGVLYFTASQTRVLVPFTAELIQRTLELLEGARRTAESSEIPPPLVDSPKCPRCSLVGICLPDEVNLLRGVSTSTQECVRPQRATTGAGGPGESLPDAESVAPIAEPSAIPVSRRFGIRRLIPTRDDKLAAYVQGQGHSVGLKGGLLQVRDKGKPLSEPRLMEISQLNLVGNVQVSAQAIRELAAREVPIMHFSYGGWLSAVTTPPPHKNIELRRRQFKLASDEAVCLDLARAFVVGKVRNSRTLLRRNAGKPAEITVHRLAESRRRAERAESLAQLLGIEGATSRDYFSGFSLMLKAELGDGQMAFDFESRNRRPPTDPINALLSFLYSMLVKDMVVTLIGIGFDPYLGFYHQPRYGRPALALDLMEEFRPLVADSVVISAINNGEVRRTDFVCRAGGVALTDSGRKRIISAYERRLDTAVTHPRFGYSVTYRRIFEVQARLLGRFINGEIRAYPPFCTR